MIAPGSLYCSAGWISIGIYDDTDEMIIVEIAYFIHDGEMHWNWSTYVNYWEILVP